MPQEYRSSQENPVRTKISQREPQGETKRNQTEPKENGRARRSQEKRDNREKTGRTGEESDRARRNQEKIKEKQKKPLGNTQKEVDPEGTKRNEVSFKEDIGFLMAKHSCARESPRLRLQLSMTPNQEGQ